MADVAGTGLGSIATSGVGVARRRRCRDTGHIRATDDQIAADNSESMIEPALEPKRQGPGVSQLTDLHLNLCSPYSLAEH